MGAVQYGLETPEHEAMMIELDDGKLAADGTATHESVDLKLHWSVAMINVVEHIELEKFHIHRFWTSPFNKCCILFSIC